MKRTSAAAAVVIALGCAMAAHAAAKCEKVTLADGSHVIAKRTKGGLSTAACEMSVTVRLTDRVPPGEFKVLKGTTAQHCTVEANDDNGDRDVVPAAWDACIKAMHAAETSS